MPKPIPSPRPLVVALLSMTLALLAGGSRATVTGQECVPGRIAACPCHDGTRARQLPGTKDAPNPRGAAVHSGVHTDYYKSVEAPPREVRDDREGAIRTPGDIRDALVAEGSP